MAITRRRFVFGTLAAGACGTLALGHNYLAEGLFNPCLADLPPDLANHELVQSAWDGIRKELVWDCHAHIAGVGDGSSGIVVHPRMDKLYHPLQYVQKVAYMNAGCAHDADGNVDTVYVERMRNLLDGMPVGYKLVLLAFDWFYGENGKADPGRSTFYVPNAYAQKIAQTWPDRFEWMASIHPYRENSIAALEEAARNGARGVKWLPAAQGMHPASPRCHAYYDALARLKLPLLVHCGEEKAVHGGDTQHYGNPLYMRAAMDRGVKVIVAHCASLGEDRDIDQGSDGPHVPSFELFARLMDDPQYRGRLFGDISAVTQINRGGEVLRRLLEKQEWHDRLLHGSDYPLPGVMPLYSTDLMIGLGLLPATHRATLIAIRRHNPLLYDFALKRHLRWQGRGFSAATFETRRHFTEA